MADHEMGLQGNRLSMPASSLSSSLGASTESLLVRHQQQPSYSYAVDPSSSETNGILRKNQLPQQLQYQSQSSQQPIPETQLSIPAALNPFPESVFSYTIFLASCLCLWVLYLLLPRGVRKQYFGANRKRYAQRLDKNMPAAGYWMPAPAAKAQSEVTTSSMDSYGNRGDAQQQQRRHQQQYAAGVLRNHVPGFINSNEHSISGLHATPSPAHLSPPRGGNYSAGSSSNNSAAMANMMKTPPSPEHPALKRIPPNKIIAETMARLQGRGIRLVAHGVHCDPKRVWIRLQDESNSHNSPNDGSSTKRKEPSVTWQTEFPRRVPDQNGQVSIVLMRGSLHSISLKNVLYIDVGKKTHALQLTKGGSIPDTVCLSLLTQNGSLDLQANSKLERDSLVSCFSMILDDIHEEDWRALYEASPEPSLASSATGGFGGNISYLYNNNNLSSSMTPGSNGAGNFQTPGSNETSGLSDMDRHRERGTPGGKNKMLQML